MSIDAEKVPALPECVTQAVKRLCVEFGGRHSAAAILAVAAVCHDNLRHAAVPVGDLDELVERSTRERLINPPYTAADIAWARALTHWTGRPAAERAEVAGRLETGQ